VASIPPGSTLSAEELRADVLRLFDDLSASLPEGERGGAGECHPSVDVVESDHAFEVFVDVAGIRPHALRLLFRGDVLLVAGEKASSRSGVPRTFHLVEREFGRFARAIRLTAALDVSAARAVVANGELHVVLPKLAERRGRAHAIPILTPRENG
jgi:HSP20 family protein